MNYLPDGHRLDDYQREVLKKLKDLNKNYSPSERIWDDAFSFKKIIDEYFKNEELKNNEFYKNICDMVGELEYEMV